MKLQKYLLSEKTDGNAVANFIRNHLSGTPRKTTADLMFTMAKKEFKGITRKEFAKVWRELIRDDYLINVGGKTFKWEM